MTFYAVTTTATTNYYYSYHEYRPRYQEYKGWQSELEQLNKVDHHAIEDPDEKVAHRDQMLALSTKISETKAHYSYVPQPRVHAHASLEENIKLHKLYVGRRL